MQPKHPTSADERENARSSGFLLGLRLRAARSLALLFVGLRIDRRLDPAAILTPLAGRLFLQRVAGRRLRLGLLLFLGGHAAAVDECREHNRNCGNTQRSLKYAIHGSQPPWETTN